MFKIKVRWYGRMDKNVFCAVFFFLFFLMTVSAQNMNVGNLSDYSPQAYKAQEGHAAVAVRALGQNEHRVYLFVPTEPQPKGEVPVVFFHHGWQGMNPMNFGALIDHLVRRGYAVIYPVYQKDEQTPPTSITEYAGRANRAALNLLSKEFGLIPKAGEVLYYGFSIGSAISVNLAMQHADYGLPPPSALFLTAPGDAIHVNQGRFSESIYAPLEQLPTQLPVTIMVGEDDEIALPTARKLSARLCHLERHRLYVLPSSRHRSNRVMAGHGSPGAPDSRYSFSLAQQQFPPTLRGKEAFESSASLNQLDFFGYWKVLFSLLGGLKANEGALQRVFDDRTPEWLSLGAWADGTPLSPMRVETYCAASDKVQ